jgi:hypothetical protein
MSDLLSSGPGTTPDSLSEVLAGISKDVAEIKSSIPAVTNTEKKPMSLGIIALIGLAVYFVFLRS